MTSPSNSLPGKSLPTEARWDELASHLPQSVAELGVWIEAHLSDLEEKFAPYITPRTMKKSILTERRSS